MIFSVVEIGQIFEVVWVSLIAGIGITTAYSFAVLGTGRSAEARRMGRGTAALVYGALAVLALGIFAVGIVFGVHTMLSKG